jgi:ketosteroid isomerase-like protein
MPTGSRTALAAVLMICAGSVQAGTEDEVRAQFSKFVSAQNAHDLKAVSDTLLDSPQFLWITRGAPIWGREVALKRFEALYQGTWSLDPKTDELKVFEVQPGVAQLYVPITFMIAPAGQTAQPTRFLMNQILVKTPEGWRISSILPIPVPMQ